MKLLKILWYILWSVGYVMLWLQFISPFEWGKKRNVSKTGREWKNRHILAPVYTLAVLFVGWVLIINSGNIQL